MLIGFDGSRAFGLERTGTENYSYYLLKALAVVDRKNRYRIYLRGNQSQRVKESKWPKNFEFVRVAPDRLWTQVGLAIETWKNPVDLLFVPAHTLPVLSSLARSRLARLKRMKMVVTIHDLGVEYLPNYHKFPQNLYLDFASKYAARHADALIAVSGATKADLEKRYGVDSEAVFVVHEGVDTGFFKPRGAGEIQKVKRKYKIDGDYVLYVGTIQPRKNLRMLIKAFGEVIRLLGQWDSRNPNNPKTQKPKNPQLVVAGKLGWDYQEILDAPKKYGVEGSVKFLGYVAREDLPALYSGSCAFAFPSLFEGFGLPILEALACGAKVIASDIGPHREIMTKFPFRLETRSKRAIQNSKFIGNSKFGELSVPMILAKVNDEGKWTKFLYHSITNYENRLSKVTQFKVVEAGFSWLETAVNTMKVFEHVF